MLESTSTLNVKCPANGKWAFRGARLIKMEKVMTLIKFSEAVAAMGDPECIYDFEAVDKYIISLDNLLDNFCYELAETNTIEVDDHGEALKENLFQHRWNGEIIGYCYSVHPLYGLTKVNKPYFMKPQVVTTYVCDRPVVEKY